jgi:hypothetical protein
MALLMTKASFTVRHGYSVACVDIGRADKKFTDSEAVKQCERRRRVVFRF